MNKQYYISAYRVYRTQLSWSNLDAHLTTSTLNRTRIDNIVIFGDEDYQLFKLTNNGSPRWMHNKYPRYTWCNKLLQKQWEEIHERLDFFVFNSGIASVWDGERLVLFQIPVDGYRLVYVDKNGEMKSCPYIREDGRINNTIFGEYYTVDYNNKWLQIKDFE